MNRLEGSKFSSPEVPDKSEAKISKEPEKKGKLSSKPVSQQSDTEVIKKVGSITKDQEVKIKEATELAKQVVTPKKSKEFKELSKKFESTQEEIAKPQSLAKATEIAKKESIAPQEKSEGSKELHKKIESTKQEIAKPKSLASNQELKAKLMEATESAKKESVVIPEKSVGFKELSKKFESTEQEIVKPQKEVGKLSEDKEAMSKSSLIDKKLTFLYQSAQSTNDKNVLNSIRKDVENLQKDIQSSKEMPQSLQDRCKDILEEINFIGRAHQVLEIVKKGASMQGYPGEVLSYEGYQFLEQMKEKRAKEGETVSFAESALTPSSIHKTTNAIKSVKKTLQEAQLGLIKGLSPTELPKIAQALKAGTATEEQVKLAVECKRLWMNLMIEEGSYLEILNFIGKKDFEGLDIIKEVAFMQGPQVDIMLNQIILEDHTKNKPDEGPPMRFLVEGAGPNGFYAALQFFRNGASVSIVGDRDERVIRSQNLILDPKLLARLNFLIGSKFDELFVDPKALGVLNLKRGSGTIKTRVLEDVMKVRTAEISSYIEDTKSFGKDTFLNVHFETPLKGIKSSDEGFSAIIGPKRRSTDTERFQRLAIEKLTKKYLSEKYAKYKPEDIIDGKSVLQRAQEEATAKWKAEQAEAKIEQPVIIFDFLACAGGANDKIRDELLEPAAPLTAPKSYAVASWIKPNEQANKKYFAQETLDRLDIKADNVGYPYLTREHIEKSLRSQELDTLLVNDKIPNEFRAKYENFTEKLLKNLETAHLPNVEEDQSICGFNIRMFENYATAFMAASTPPLLSEFLRDLNQLIDTTPAPENESLKNLKKEIDKKWMNTLAGVFDIDPNVVKLDEEYPINLGTFDVQQKAINTGAKLLETGKCSVVIAAFGDSRASPHFFSGSGLSTGRLGIDNGAETLRKFNRKEIQSKTAFVKQLKTELDQVKEKAIERGRRFVKPNDPSERGLFKCITLTNTIKEHFNQQQKTPLDITKTGWKIDTEVDEKGNFDLSFMDKTGKKHSLKVQINEEDGQIHARGKKYLVFNDLLVELGVA